MLTRTVCLFIAGFIPFLLNAAPNTHVASCHNKSCKLVANGTVNLTQTRNLTRAKAIPFKINDSVKGMLRVYQSRVNNKDLIKGQFLVDNTSRQQSILRYRVIFKDNVGIVAQSKGELHVGPGKNQKMKFGSIVMPVEHMDNIRSYEIRVNAW